MQPGSATTRVLTTRASGAVLPAALQESRRGDCAETCAARGEDAASTSTSGSVKCPSAETAGWCVQKMRRMAQDNAGAPRFSPSLIAWIAAASAIGIHAWLTDVGAS